MNTVLLEHYVPLALRTEKPLPEAHRYAHASLGLTTETGEIVTQIKRIAIYGKSLEDRDKPEEGHSEGKTLRQHISEEIGDMLWYMAIPSNALGFNFVYAMEGMQPLYREGRTNAGRLFKAALSLPAPVGRFAGLADLVLRHEGTTPGLRDAMHQELSYIAQELVNIADAIEVPLERIAGQNIAKLRKRFPDAYSDEAAEARADKGGLDARNS